MLIDLFVSNIGNQKSMIKKIKDKTNKQNNGKM